MSTFLTQALFKELLATRARLRDDPACGRENIAGIFVPWAGDRLRSEGGIYYIGIATDGAYGACEPQTFRTCAKRTAEMCQRNERSMAPFWRMLNSLTTALLGHPYEKVSDRWGWSNLLKIGYSVGTPSSWPRQLVDLQRPVCISALQHELSCLSNSLIFVASNDERGILTGALGSKASWDRKYEDDGIWWWRDESARNIYVHGYHPNAAQHQKIYEAQLVWTTVIAKEYLAWARRQQ